MSSNTEIVDVTRPGSRLGQQPPASSPMMPGVNVTAAPGECECHDILGGHQDHHQEPCLTQPKTGVSHPLGEREESPPKRMRLEDDEDMEHQRSSLRNSLKDPQQRTESDLYEAENNPKEDSQHVPTEQTPMNTEDAHRSSLRNCLRDPQQMENSILLENERVSKESHPLLEQTPRMDEDNQPPSDQERSVFRTCSMVEALDAPQPEICPEDANISSLKSIINMKNSSGDEVESISPKETTHDPEKEEIQKSTESNCLKSAPAGVLEEEVPVKEVEITIFEDLRIKHAAAGKKDWELVRYNEKLAAFGFLEKSLLLVLTLKDKLEPKRSRKSLGRIVHHWSIRDIKMVSTHRGDGNGEAEETDGDIMDTGDPPPVVSFRKFMFYLISAHHIVRRKLPEISLLSLCPNTHSLSSFLKDVSRVVSSTVDFIRSLQFTRDRFFPFSVSDHRVTFGEFFRQLFLSKVKSNPPCSFRISVPHTQPSGVY